MVSARSIRLGSIVVGGAYFNSLLPHDFKSSGMGGHISTRTILRQI